MQRFEFNDGTSSKFWEIEQQGCDVKVCFGKMGTAGQQQTKTHADAAKASTALAKLIKEKTAKGYVACGAGASGAAAPPAPPKVAPVPTPAATPVPAKVAVVSVAPPVRDNAVAAVAAVAPPVLSGAVPPWEATGPVLDVPAELAARALPSRQRPGPPPASDAKVSWERFLAFARELRFDPEQTSKPFRPALVEAAARVANNTPEGSAESDMILLAFEAAYCGPLKPGVGAPFLDYLVATKGLAHAVDVFIRMQHHSLRRYYSSNHKSAGFDASTNWNYGENHIGDAELALRAHLAGAEPALWEQCAEALRAAIPGLPKERRAVIAVLLPELPELADQLALMPPQLPDAYSWLRIVTTNETSLAALHYDAPGKEYRQYFYPSTSAVMTLVMERGVNAVSELAPAAFIPATAKALACIGTPASITALALACNTTKDSSKRLLAVVQRWPHASIAALSELIAIDGKGPLGTASVLNMLVQAHAESLPAFQAWLSPAALKVIDAIAQRFATPLEMAEPSDLPPILTAPPWTRPPKKAAPALTLEPLALAPVERWSTSERQALISSFREHHRFPRARLTSEPATMASALGYYSKALEQEIAAAITARNSAAVLAVLAKREAEGGRNSLNGEVIGLMPETMAADLWNGAPLSVNAGHAFVVGTLGLKALPGLTTIVDNWPQEYLHLSLHFASVELATVVARVFDTMKSRDTRAVARKWLLTNPEHSACALIAPALGKPGAARTQAGTALRLLAGAGHGELLMDVASRYQRDDVSAAMAAMLAEDPLDLYPAKIGKLPDFWQPLAWARPLLASNGKAIPDAALDDIGIMLRFPSADTVYAGIAQLRQACTPASLAEFAWDLFRAWNDGGAESKESWALVALGLLGNDDTARKLTPLIRAWPGEAQHARAVTGLDILAAIGSDTALMLLNGIAQKIKFKGLQDRAREKISVIAEARELTTEELEDRLAPDLGLDQGGSLQLDFGPRQFQVGFDETLKPYVRDTEGARLPDLPKPKKTDDAELSAAAVERFKLLKKDARMIASQQVLRLELAMCARRRWTMDVFCTFLAEHPLLRHLVQRVVWGVYRVADNASYGGELLACFRVTPEGTYTDANDDAFAVPLADGIRIGIPHMLDLPAASAAAFGQLFADYELLQPFAQIGRDTYTFSAAEMASTEVARWQDSTAPTGRVLGLVNKGWRRGNPLDGGGIHFFTKEVGDGRMIVLFIEPGITVGMMEDAAADQKLLSVAAGTACDWGRVDNPAPMSSIDPIAASELIRDIEGLRA